MIFSSYYNIDIALNNKSLEISPNETYFSMHDSIHNMFSNGLISLNDSTGLLREYLVQLEGNHYTLTYGLETQKNNILKNTYVVESDETEEVSAAGLLNGQIKLNLINKFYDNQIVSNTVHSGKNSDIIRNIVSNNGFNKVNIDSTEGTSKWYQLASTQSQFIKEVLLPNSYSPNADKSPFFVFIDNNNEFNFKSYKSMLSANSVATLNYIPVSSTNIDINTIYDVKPFKVGSRQTKQLRNRLLIERSLSDGTFTKKNDYMNQYPSSKATDALLPIIGQKSQITGYDYLSFQHTKKNMKEYYEARKYYGQKNSYFLEKFILTLAFNPMLTSGKTVDLNLSILDEKLQPNYSLYNSGKFLIEDSTHTWTGGQVKRGTTQLIVSRKYCYVPKSYFLKSKIIG